VSRIEAVELEVKTLSQNLETSIQDNKQRDQDIPIHYNDVSEQLSEIKGNHLKHLNLKINVTLSGLVFIAIMLTILGIMIAVD